ncbi:helix-turn-helix domain-containing protein, partial [Rhizobium leguminosarum]
HARIRRQDDVQRMSPEDRFGIRNAKFAFVVRSEASTLPNFAAAADIVFGPQAVVVSGKRIALAPIEMRILRFLFEKQGQISTREQLIEGVWPDPHAVESRTVDVHIGRLRRAFAGLRNLRIRTAYGAGYALDTTIVLPMS